MTVLEGSQTSIRWFEHLSKIDAENDDLKLVIVHFDLDMDNSIARLKKRNQNKGREINDKKIESVRGKKSQFDNIYKKIINSGFKNAISLDASKSEQQIFQEILNYTFNDL